MERTRETAVTWRQRRLVELARAVQAGEYSVPAEEVATAILMGRPKWGDDPQTVDSQSEDEEEEEETTK